MKSKCVCVKFSDRKVRNSRNGIKIHTSCTHLFARRKPFPASKNTLYSGNLKREASKGYISGVLNRNNCVQKLHNIQSVIPIQKIMYK